MGDLHDITARARPGEGGYAMTIQAHDFEPVRSAMPRRFYARWLKRPFDVLFVALIAPVVVPVVLALAALAALDGHNPFYGQWRIGRGGRRFRMWKIRTMVPNADAVLESHLAADPALRREWDHHQKLSDDPRITWAGRLLRRSSLDELPQFWNVITGDMSVVGPRPMMDSQAALYMGRAYYALRPGVTGPWQVSDRNETSFTERARFDEDYATGLSLGSDLSLVGRTVGAMLRCTGR